MLGKEKENNKKEAEDFSLILPNKQMEEEELGNAVTPRAKVSVFFSFTDANVFAKVHAFLHVFIISGVLRSPFVASRFQF